MVYLPNADAKFAYLILPSQLIDMRPPMGETCAKDYPVIASDSGPSNVLEQGHQIPEITRNNPAIGPLLNLLHAPHLQHGTKDQWGKV